MNNWNIAVDASNTSMNSFGSSLREQERYSQSFEARINRLDTAWNKFTLSMGDAVLTDGLIAAIEVLNDLATVASKVIDTVGVLPIVFGTAGAATVLLSTRFRTLTTSIMFGTEAMSASALATAGLTADMTRGAVAVTGMKMAMRGLMASTVVGAIFVGIGWALEKLIGLYSEAKQKQQEFEEAQRKNIDALTTNKEQTELLIASYKRLSEEKEKGTWDTEKEKEYLQIQNQLGELYPNLIESVSTNGQMHLKSSKQIDKEIAATKELIQLKKDEIKLKALENLEEAKGDTSDTKKKLKNKKDELAMYEGINPDYLTDKDKERMNKLKQEIISLETEISTKSQKVTSEVLKISEAYNKLKIDPEISSSVDDLLSSLDFTKLSPEKLETASIEIARLTDKMQKAYESGDNKGFEKAEESLRTYLKSLGFSDAQVNSFNLSLADLSKKATDAANATYNGKDGMDALAEGAEGAAESTTELKDSVEALLGISSDQINDIYTLISQYQLLSQMENLSAEQKQYLANVTAQLASLYPDLVAGSGMNIEAMKTEIEATDILAQAIEKLANGEASAQDAMTIAAAIGAKNRLEMLRKEIEAYNDYINQADGLSANTLEKEKLYQKNAPKINSNIDSLITEIEGYTSSLSSSMDIQGKYSQAQTDAAEKAEKNAEAQEKAKDSFEQSTYVANQYQMALESVNAEIERQNTLQQHMAQYSQEYRDSVKKEIELLKQKMNLMKQQASILQSQINSGVIPSTGIQTTKYSSGGSSGSGASSSVRDYYLNNFRVTSKFNEDRGSYNHKGLDLANGRQGDLVKAMRGGKVITATYSSSAGNWVVIQQDDGTVAKYMHMQNGSLAVKAGQTISAGQTLGKVGNTGQSSGAHLHLQVEANGKLIDPMTYLQNLNTTVSSSANDAVSEASRIEAERQQSVDQAKMDLIGMQTEIMNLQYELQQAYMDLIESNIAAFDRIRDSYSDDLAKIDLIQNRETETSKEWIDQQKAKEGIVDKQIEQQKKSIEYIKEEIKSNTNLSDAQKMLLEDKLVERYSELYSLEQNLLDQRITMAEKIIDTYKKGLEAQKQAAVDTIDKMIEDINKATEEDEYKKNLSKEQKNRQEIQDEINSIALDGSDWANKRRKELTEQLQESDQSIVDMQTEKSKNNRIDNLNNQKEAVEEHFDNLINDEKKFAEMRSNIINANSSQIQKDLQGFYDNIIANTKILGTAMANNLIDLINQANMYLNGKDYKPVKIASMDTGGMTPSFKGGKFLLAHEKEMVLNKSDTSNFLKALDITRDLVGKLTSNIRLPQIQLPSITQQVASGGNSYSISIAKLEVTGDQNGVNKFFKGVEDEFKRLGGKFR